VVFIPCNLTKKISLNEQCYAELNQCIDLRLISVLWISLLTAVFTGKYLLKLLQCMVHVTMESKIVSLFLVVSLYCSHVVVLQVVLHCVHLGVHSLTNAGQNDRVSENSEPCQTGAEGYWKEDNFVSWFAIEQFLPIQCYANTMGLCLSVTTQYYIEMTAWIKLILAYWLPSIYPTLYFKLIWVSTKVRVHPSKILSKKLDLENLATACPALPRAQQTSRTWFSVTATLGW